MRVSEMLDSCHLLGAELLIIKKREILFTPHSFFFTPHMYYISIFSQIQNGVYSMLVFVK